MPGRSGGGLLFREKNRGLREAAVAILGDEHPMTLRQLYYRCVSAGHLANSQAEYKRLGKVMARLREAGEVPLTWIVDHVRATLKPSSWSGLADFGETVRHAYRKDLWARMPDHVEIIVEKDAIAGTVRPVTDEYDVALQVCRGYASVSFAGEVAEVWKRVGKPIHAYSLGDFDPSGFDIERDLRERLVRYSGKEWAEDGRAEAGQFAWGRLAIRPEDFAAFNLIPPAGEEDRHPGAEVLTGARHGLRRGGRAAARRAAGAGPGGDRGPHRPGAVGAAQARRRTGTEHARRDGPGLGRRKRKLGSFSSLPTARR
jgi:hypothetical protein